MTMNAYTLIIIYFNMSYGVFGWAVVLKKVVVRCELWKKLLWVMSCEKTENRLVENCCEASFFWNFKFQTWEITEFSKLQMWKLLNFQISNLKNCQMSNLKNIFFEISNFNLENCIIFKISNVKNCRMSNLKNHRISNLKNYRISDLKNCWILDLKNPTAGKITSHDTFRIKLQKIIWDKAGSFG
jgi:hypothetical protein